MAPLPFNASEVQSALGTSETVSMVITAAIIIVATIILGRIVNRLLKDYFKRAAQKLNVDATTYVILGRLAVALVYLGGVIVLLYSIPGLNGLATALFAGAGFLGIVVGLAAQGAFGNIISGVFIATFQPFRVGDRVEIEGQYGEIEDITLRHTVVRVWDNRRLVIPNDKINQMTITNFSIEDPTMMWPLDMGISYDSDIDRAREIMLEEAREHPDVIEELGEPMVRVTACGDFAVNLRMTYWVEDRAKAFATACDLRERVKKRFDEEGIEIPFPYRTLVYKKDLEDERRPERPA